MANKQGQPTKTGNQESQGNQPHQEETKRGQQQQDGSNADKQQGGKTGPQPGSQTDRKGKLG